MTKKKYITIVIIFLVALIGISYLFFKSKDFISFIDCKIVESNEKGTLFKRTPGTFDPTEYGLNVYFIASDEVMKELNTLASRKDIDLSKNVYITMQYNKLLDIKKEEDAVYITIRKIIDIENSDYVAPL